MRALIVGAGVGGLATARALVAGGNDVVVVEQAPGLREGGAAVTLWSNGTGILAELGVSLDGVGGTIDRLEQCDWRGRVLLSVDVARAAARYGFPHICLPRRRLLERLTDGLEPGAIRYGQACVGIAEEGTRVRLDLGDGSFETGDLLIGADGRSSVVRDTLWGKDPARPTGWVTWQGVTAIPTKVTSSRRGVMFVGPAGLCGLMPAGGGFLQWWFDHRWSPSDSPPDSPVAALRKRFGGWAAPVREVLEQVDDDDVGFFPHYGHPVPSIWGEGAITLVGDAAHSMPPTRAQGANQALEDAWAMAKVLRGGPDLASVLRSYERTRSPKAGLVSRQALKEDTNQYRPWRSRLLPDAAAARLYTRWLGQVSNYLH